MTVITRSPVLSVSGVRQCNRRRLRIRGSIRYTKCQDSGETAGAKC
ncbi:hypothetical protein [Paenibacillus xylanexedens]|nr:hypothetical protein [Paenibacillus xylanexedens]